MKTTVEIDVDAQSELDSFRPGCSTEPPDPGQCTIHGVWLCLPCGKKLFDLSMFLSEDQLEGLAQEAVMEAEADWAADEADAMVDHWADADRVEHERSVGHHG